MFSRPRCALLALWAIAMLAANSNIALAVAMETCNFETFSASCNSDKVLLVSSAELGRMRVGRCITENEFIGCRNDVLPQVDRWCSGRRQCEFPVIDLDQNNKECSRSLRMYLQVEYMCLNVENRCTPGQNILTKDRGHLSNQISCGSPKPHWTIRAQVGQIINMSLIDFAASDKLESFITCKYVYGYILERALGINHTICGGKHREGALYSSKTNSVEIQTSTEIAKSNNFIITYEIIGCTDLKRPQNTWYRRQGSEAVIGCETNDQEWRLTCTGNTWQGRVGNCTEQPKVAVIASSKEKENRPITMSSVVMMTGFVGAALVLIVVVIVIAVVYLQKYRLKKQTAHIERTYATMGRNTMGPTHTAHMTGPKATGTMQLTNHGEILQLTGANMTSYPTQWTCATLPNNEIRSDPLIELGDEKEALYNSLK